jgi:hypothetical protein
MAAYHNRSVTYPRKHPPWTWLSWLICTSFGSSACILEAPSEWTLPDYDPQQFQATVSTKILQVRAQYPQTCQAQLMIEMQIGQAAQLYGDQNSPLNFELSSQANYAAPIALAPIPAAQVQLVPANTGISATQAVPLWIRTPPGQWGKAGTYQQRMRISLMDPMGRTLAERMLTLWQPVRPKVSLQFAQTGSTQTDLDFGQLEQGKTRQADIQVKHNTPYLLQLSSQNSGVLRNTQHLQSTIAYRLQLDGSNVDLNNTLNIRGHHHNNNATTQHQLRIEIQDVKRVRAGNYQDNLSLTIQAQ